MKTQDIWNTYHNELYFFVLKKVQNKHAANDIFQSTFLKIHKHLPSLKQENKLKAWVFQIARNEIANYFQAESAHVDEWDSSKEVSLPAAQFVCCLDKLINDLPEMYREVIELVYIQGNKQKDVAVALGISLENTKARIRRAKDMLKEKFRTCCKYEVNKKGKLIGEPDCVRCSLN